MINMLFDFLLINATISESTAKIGRSLVDHPTWKFATIPFHHRQVFVIVMNLKKQISREQLTDDATNRPNVSYLVPLTTLEDHFRRPVLSCADNSRMIVIVLGSPTKVDDSYLC